MSTEMQYNKVAPHDLKLESAALGAILIDREAFPLVSGVISETTFYLERHQEVFKACKLLWNTSNPIDILTVTDQLRKAGKIDLIGGAYYLVELTQMVASAANLEFHCRILRQKEIQRQLINVSNDVIRRAYEDTDDAFALLEHAQKSVYDISAIGTKESIDISTAVQTALLEIERANKGQEMFTFGLSSLDKKMGGGIMGGEMFCIAARPGMGKTELALLSAFANARKGKKVWFVSLEMSASQLAKRLMSKLSGIKTGKLRSGDLQDSEWLELKKAADGLMILPFKIAAFKTPESLRSAVHRAKLKNDIDILYVDYLQLMDGDGKSQNREREIANISRTLKVLTIEFNMPVVPLSQLNRAVESRANKKPGLQDLRESGSIEHDCDAVMFIMRPEAYGIDSVVINTNGSEQVYDTSGGALIYSEKFRNDTNFNAWVQFKDGHFYDWPDNKQFPTSEFSSVKTNPKPMDEEDFPF